MKIFEEATKIADERFDREKLLSITSKLIARFRLPNAQDKTKMRGACRHLADALGRCSGSTATTTLEPLVHIISLANQRFQIAHITILARL